MAQEILLRILIWPRSFAFKDSGSSSMNYFWVQTEHLEKGYRLANMSVEYKKKKTLSLVPRPPPQRPM